MCGKLFDACCSGNKELEEYLIENGADINKVDDMEEQHYLMYVSMDIRK